MISGLYIFDSKGDVLISKLYRSGIGRNISDVFRIHVISAASNRSAIRSPVLTLGSTSFIYIRSGQLWLCAVARSNQDCATIMAFLFRLETLLKLAVGEKHLLTSEAIVNHFSTVYDIVDEAANFGYPIDTNPSYFLVHGSSELLSSFLKRPKGLAKKRSSGTIATLGLPKIGNSSSVSLDGTADHDSGVSWRQPGIKYRRNEVFVNIEEKVSALISPEGGLVLRSSVDGIISMRTHLSGMPECRFGLGDDCVFLSSASLDVSDTHSGVVLENTKLHHSVDLSRFDSNREIQFIPPDGEFQLMSYHCLSNINLPFDIVPEIHQLGHKIVYKIKIRSLFPSKIAATGVVIRVPTPQGIVRNYASPSQGKAKFHPEESAILWKFNKLFGDQQHTLTAEVGWNESTDYEDEDNVLKWQRPPIKIDFHLDMYACSGLTVKFLKVHDKSNYRTIKWVNYKCTAGNYNVRF